MSDLKKFQTPFTFPKLGVGDVKERAYITETEGQAKTKNLASLAAHRQYVGGGIRNKEEKETFNEMMDQEKAHINPKGDLGFTMRGAFSTWGRGKDTKQFNPAHPTSTVSAVFPQQKIPEDPSKPIGQRHRGTFPEAGVQIHEGTHDIFGRIAETHGKKARLALAVNLFYAIPASHGGNSVRFFAKILKNSYKTHEIPEESLCFATNYLNDQGFRDTFHKKYNEILSKLGVTPRQFEKGLKAANHWIRSASKNIDHSWLRPDKFKYDKHPVIAKMFQDAKEEHYILDGDPRGRLNKAESDNKVSLIMCYDEHGRLLLGKRNDTGKWTLPGGHINPGENPRDAAYRELKEETGLDPISLSFLNILPGEPDLIVFTAYVSGNPTGKNDPDKECNKWQFVDTTDGAIPKNIYDNLHGPKEVDVNVVKQIFDSKLKRSEKVWLDVGFCDLLKVEDPQDEVSCLLKHPDPTERAMALKLHSAELRHIIAAAMDPHHKVWSAAINHPAYGHMALLAMAASTRDSSGRTMWHQHDHLLKHHSLDEGHLRAMHDAIVADPSIPEQERMDRLHLVLGHPKATFQSEFKKAEEDDFHLFAVHANSTRGGHYHTTNHEGEAVLPQHQNLAEKYKQEVDRPEGTPKALQRYEFKGAHPKVVYPTQDEQGNKSHIIVKPHHSGLEDGNTSSGWNELTSQALYHAGGIGHLHQNVIPVKHGSGENRVPAIAVFTEPGKDLGQCAAKETFSPTTKADAHKIALMDFLTGNNDRHEGNLLRRPDGNIFAIDHGGAFYGWRGFLEHAHDEGLSRFTGQPTPADSKQNRDIVNNFKGALDWWGQAGAAIKAEMGRRLELFNDKEGEEYRRIKAHFDIRSRMLDDLHAKSKAGTLSMGDFRQNVPENHDTLWDVEDYAAGLPISKAMHNEDVGFLEQNPDEPTRFAVPGGDWHKNFMSLHPETVAPRAQSFETNINSKAKKIKPLYSHEDMLDKIDGIQRKTMFRDGLGNMTLIKPFHDEDGEEFGGAKEMLSQAMYHAGGIGHLHQQTSIHEHKGQDGIHRPVLAIHMEPNVTSVKEAINESGPHLEAAQGHLNSLKTDSSKHLPFGQVAVMDSLTGNSDRNVENLMVRSNGMPLAIDHGKAFGKTKDFMVERNAAVRQLPKYEQPHHVFTKTPGLKEWWDGAKDNIMKAFDDHAQHLPEKQRNEFTQNVQHNFNELEKKFNRVD